MLTSVKSRYGYSEESVVLKDELTGRIRGFNDINGSDFYLGALTRVHSDLNGVQCSHDFVERGLEEAEAMLFAIDSVNNDPDLLPTIRLGYDIRDYCGAENVALDEVIDWALTSSVVTNSQECDQCTDVKSQGSVFAAVIGAFHSRVSGPVASFLRPFEIPQISFGSTSPALSSRLRYSYFLRTVPPDTVQSQVVVSIMQSQGWNVVSAVHSNELYGEFGIDVFRALAPKVGICLDLDEGINEDFTTFDYSELAQRIYNSSTSVVLLFALEQYVRPLLSEFSKLQPPKRFVWIATDTWAESTSLQEEFGDMLVGMIGVAPFTPTPKEFTTEYYQQVTPSSNKRDPFFRDYCDSFLSSIGETCANDTSIASAAGYLPGTFVPFIVQAVYSAAHGLQDFLNENCDHPVEWNRATKSCKGQNVTLNSSVLFDYISGVNFTIPMTDVKVAFDEFGNPEVAEYKVVNFQKTPSGENTLTDIGRWDSMNALVLDNSREIQFGVERNGNILLSFESHCQLCSSGEIQVLVPSSCCNLCVPCTDDTYANSTSSTKCLQCGMHMWGNNPVNGSDGCVPLEEVYLSYDSPWGISIIVFSVFGIISVTTVSLIVLIFFWKNPVIKSFGREQLILILIGLVLSFIFPFFYIIRPSIGLCSIHRIDFWFSLTLISAALLVKLVRVTRIFLGGIKSGRRCIKPWYQVLFTFLIVGGQMVLVVVSMIVVPPAVNTEVSKSMEDVFPILIITCADPHIAILVLLYIYDSVLVILINGFAIFTIRFPKNFKEARNIALATFAIGMVWLAFIPIYFTTDNEFQAGAIAFAMMCVAFIILACLILPRLGTAFINRNAKMFSSQQSRNNVLESSQKKITNGESVKVQRDSSVIISLMIYIHACMHTHFICTTYNL